MRQEFSSDGTEMAPRKQRNHAADVDVREEDCKTFNPFTRDGTGWKRCVIKITSCFLLSPKEFDIPSFDSLERLTALI